MKTKCFLLLILVLTAPVVYAELAADQLCNGIATLARNAAVAKNSGVSLSQMRTLYHKYVNNMDYPQETISFANIIGDRMIKAVYEERGYVDPDQAWSATYTACVDAM